MTERRFSLAVEDADSSESPDSPPNKPLCAFLVENTRPPLKKSLSFTSVPNADSYLPPRRFSICDLNTFSEEASQRLLDSSSAAPRTCNFRNHHRRNSVAIKFSIPRTADTATTAEER